MSEAIDAEINGVYMKPMKLSDWLRQRDKDKKRTQDRLAIAVGVTQGRISQIAARGTRDLEMALRIQEATGGDVTLADLFYERPQPKKRRAGDRREATA